MNIIRSIIMILLVVCMFGCQDKLVEVGKDTVALSGTVALSFDQPPSDVSHVVATLSRRGFPDKVLNLAISDSQSASGTMSNVEIGVWHLRVDAFNDSGTVKYTGETNVEVLSGQAVVVTLQLHGTSGNIEIQVTWGNGCAPVTVGLVSWWRAEDNANDEIGSNNGALMNGVTLVTGKVGKAFSFNTSGSYIRIPNSPSLNVTSSFTLEAWIYPQKDTIAIIISKWGIDYGWSGQRSYALDLWSGRKIHFGIVDQYHQNDSAFQAFGSPLGVIALNRWNHVAGVYDKTTGKRRIYVNGAKVAERIDPPIDILQSQADVSIGAYLWSPNDVSHFFPGMIDEVSLYHRALTDGEIGAIYRSGNAGKCK